MKKNVIALVMVMILTLLTVGCGEKGGTDITGTSQDVASVMTKLADYGKIVVAAEDVEPTAEEVMYQMQAEPYYYAQVEGKTVIETGDIVNINYRGLIDGEAFDGGTSSGYDLEIGSGSFIEGFEEQLVGKELGKSYELDLAFPEDYWNAELAGVDVIFEVTVNAIQEQVETTEEMATETVREQKLENAILVKLLTESEFTMDPDEVQLMCNEMVDQYRSIGQMVGGMDVYLEYMGITQEQLNAMIVRDVYYVIQTILLVDEIVRQEDLATEEELLNGVMADGTLLDDVVLDYLKERTTVK